ncbi:hypothetical protein ACFPYI_13720 [Halomarina salina]|uniref:Halobacterial output domain-containing protein n=1 Tax=Halomarina salina TaxID=1872699 RepID=A0ABD5RQ61_9EURY|nr:hypothetical protein [Halomarina salina]
MSPNPYRPDVDGEEEEDHVERIRELWPDDAPYPLEDAWDDIIYPPDMVRRSNSTADEVIREDLPEAYMMKFLDSCYDEHIPDCPDCGYHITSLDSGEYACINVFCQSRFELGLVRAGDER